MKRQSPKTDSLFPAALFLGAVLGLLAAVQRDGLGTKLIGHLR